MMLTTKNINWRTIPGLVHKKKNDFSINRYTIEQVAEIVGKHLGITVNQMKVRTRLRPIVEARQITGYICTKLLMIPFTTKVVGRFFLQDHATVVNGNRVTANFIETDSQFQYKAMIIFKALDL